MNFFWLFIKKLFIFKLLNLFTFVKGWGCHMNKETQSESSTPLSWVEMQSDKVKTTLLERHERFLLLAKARWFFLAFVAIYGAGAGVGYFFSDYGWFLTTSQLVGMLVGLLTILTYNTIYFFNHKRLANHAWGSHL